MKRNASSFNGMMDFAREVEQQDPRGLLSVIRILGKEILSNQLIWRINSKKFRYTNTEPDWLFLPRCTKIGPAGESYLHLCPDLMVKKRIDLAKDLVIPSPWEPRRLANCIASIGQDRKWGKWKYDKNNHYVEFWEPLGLAWGTNGNHSITAGIIAANGKLPVKVYRNIALLYKYVFCDGKNYVDRHGKVLNKVNSIEFAAIFEIGRMLVNHGVTAK